MSTPSRLPRQLTRQLAIAGIVFGLLQVLIFALLIGAVRSAEHANDRSNDVLAAVQTMSDLEKSVIDAETGMRGYVITGRQEFLQPLDAARSRIPDQERLVRKQVTDADELPLIDPLIADIDAYQTQWIDRAVATTRRTGMTIERPT